MEERFKNQHIRDKDAFKEIAIYSLLKQPVILICHIAFSVACLWGSIFSPSWYLYIVALVVYCLWFVLRGSGFVKSCFNREKELTTNEPVVHTMTFFDDKIVYENTNGTSLDLDYSIIKKVASEKKYYFLVTNQKQFFVLKKDSFVTGEEKDFLSFMKEKIDKSKNTK